MFTKFQCSDLFKIWDLNFKTQARELTTCGAGYKLSVLLV